MPHGQPFSRDGEYIDTKMLTDVTEEQLVHLMVGRKMDEMFPKVKVGIGEPALK